MKVLLLRRKSWGELGEYTDALAAALGATLEDAEEWMPQPTGKAHDKAASKQLRAKAEGYDLVHAFGSRCAWACAEAFGEKRAWVWSAYETPATDHPQLLRRLGQARGGLCASHFIRRKLGESVSGVRVRFPGMAPVDIRNQDLAPAKEALGLEPGTRLILTRRPSDSVVDALERIRKRVPEAALMALHGETPEGYEPVPRVPGTLEAALAAADLWLDDREEIGFSLPTVRAMMMGVPVIVRDSGGLPEMIIERTSGAVFRDDYSLADVVASHLQMPEHLVSMGYAGRVRALEQFHLQHHTDEVTAFYEKVLGRKRG